MNKFKRFENKKALITGAGGGIGSVLVQSLRNEGAIVAVTDLDTSKINADANFDGDLLDPIFCDQLPNKVYNKFNGIDILCNVAGFISRGKIDTISDETELEVWLSSKKIGLDSPVSTFNKNKITGRLNPINGIPKSLNSDKKIFWSGYTNGWLGYLPTAKAYEEGGYETRNTPLSPESEELILDICDSEIKKFY